MRKLKRIYFISFNNKSWTDTIKVNSSHNKLYTFPQLQSKRIDQANFQSNRVIFSDRTSGDRDVREKNFKIA